MTSQSNLERMFREEAQERRAAGKPLDSFLYSFLPDSDQRELPDAVKPKGRGK